MAKLVMDENFAADSSRNMEKVILITGATSGIGREAAMQLAGLGHAVIATGRDANKCKDLQAQLETVSSKSRVYRLDVLKPDDMDVLLEEIGNTYGRLDVLVNNAGVQLDLPGFMPGNTSETVSADVLRSTYETNFFSPVLLTQKALPLLKKSEGGAIINVASIMGSMQLHSDSTSPIYSIKLLAYNSSKTALNQFTIHLAEALKDTSVKVNSVHPGWVKTDLGGPYAPMEIAEGAKTIVDLCLAGAEAPQGSFIHLGNPLP